MADVFSPSDAARSLADLRVDRDSANHRAAGLSLMIWALVVTSAAGSLVMLNGLTRIDMGPAGWLLFLLGNIAVVAAWVAVGSRMQDVVWQAFPSTRQPPERRRAVAATGVAFAMVASNLFLQGLFRSINGIGPSAPDDQLHHNLAFAFAMGIGGAIVMAVSILMAGRGFRARPGYIAGGSMLLGGHLTTLLWFPSLGIVGPLLAVASVPIVFLTLGFRLWRRG